MGRKNFRDLKLRRHIDVAQKFAALAQRCLEERSPVQPQQIEGDKRDRHVGGNIGEQIGALIFSAQSFLQIKKCQLLPVFESHNLAIENHILPKVPSLLRNLDELFGHPSEIARENFDALAAAMQLGANAVELVLDVNGVDFA